jgi:hypothetical protein
VQNLFPFEWYLPKGTKYASDAELDKASSACEFWAIRCGALVIVSVIAELIMAWCDPAYETFLKLSIWPDAAIGIGIVGEVLFGMWDSRVQTELRGRSNARLGVAEKEAANANERAAKADLARAELEAKLLPRMLNQEQWDFIQGLRGKFAEISIAFETDAETRWFAGQIRDAFFSAGIRVGMVARAADVHSTGILVYEPKGFDGSRAKTVEPLIELFRKADILPAVAVISGGLPSDVVLAIANERSEIRPLMDVPMIIVGGRFVIPPPQIEKAAKAAKAAMAKTARESNI